MVERVRHVAFAGLIALVLYLMTALDPIDQFTWAIQSRISHEEASGQIAFIGTDDTITDPAIPEGRRRLANLIDRLDEAGVEAVYVDLLFDAGSEEEADRSLNRALAEFSGEAVLVRDLVTGFDGDQVMRDNSPLIKSGIAEVTVDSWVSYLGYTWYLPYAAQDGSQTLPNLAAELAGKKGDPGDVFPVSYNFELASIPSFRMTELLSDPERLRSLEGKTVVIGISARNLAEGHDIPGHRGIPPSMISIYGAETLLAGDPRYVGGLITFLASLASLLVISTIRRRVWRQAGYAAIIVAILLVLAITAQTLVRISMAYALALPLIYALFRVRALWKRNLLLVDPNTGLPTFSALEANEDAAQSIPAIIVARIHRFEEVRRTLPVEMHADYVRAIVGRLKAATQDATIYLGQGHMIAWTMAEKEPALLREHLEGLRALFASPLIVGEQQVDVGITFGIDITPSPNVARRIASAVAVAEKTTETFEPIAIADSASQEDLIWNISLQSRIDAALANGEIYLAFQPKAMLQTGEIVGAEALVRWKDPVKGHIPPDAFIRQCETAGRMSQLTQFVLTRACETGNTFRENGFDLSIAVNISATLLHERSIVSMVSKVLEETGYDPGRLTLEITETYRISNLDLAAEILNELRALGPKISMDDFGVGAASLEALLRLPFSELKIDRAFITPMANDAKALGIVKTILQLGRELRIIVVAEGVEDAGTLTLLRNSGCEIAQGFAISRPVRMERILEYQKDENRHLLRNMV
ncbi:EAL domain-containing protein [Aurantiacibacter poecillastricola]|uniref:EAL domain-containing protein n=1 Tax=Aurantiacibacter poecillastricola TaxID=3064385 RepID=UPI0027401E2D|nr:EAL domain-containing protein [Aurantiacibacter sp. 219JJ12-13]MDP5261025.1 EAL domain-containing protein [Aurantiacibacter sp. 219JJ12-13]